MYDIKRLVGCDFAFVDLFCGAGGVSLGVENAFSNNRKIAEVVACVNHDPKAIDSHRANFPHAWHFNEDITTLGLKPLRELIERIRAAFPHIKIVLWGSLECTNHSNAKGGLSRDADSRSLAEHLPRYLAAINPDMLLIENVREFLDWGPLIVKINKTDEGYDCCPLAVNKKKGTVKPVLIPDPQRKGEDYNKWREEIKRFGYKYDYRILNCADYGSYTFRKRLFIQFVKWQLPIVWPQPTHSKTPTVGLKPWNPVRDVLDFKDKGASIFGRKKKYCKKSLDRVYAGLVKFIAKGDTSYIYKYLGNNLHTGINNGRSINEPSLTITCQSRLAIVQTAFLCQSNGSKPTSKVASIDSPSRVITATGGNLHLTQPEYLVKYYSTGENLANINEPSPSVPAQERIAIVQPEYFITRDFTSGSNNSSIEKPAGALTSVPKVNIIEACPFIVDPQYKGISRSIDEPSATILASRKQFYLLNPQYLNEGSSIDNPCFTLIARMDKMPPYLVEATPGVYAIEIYETDTPEEIKIKQFMAAYGIADIRMRMLRIVELKRIQGFPDEYVLKGSQAHQKKQIGNAVPKEPVSAWVYAFHQKLQPLIKSMAS